MQPGFPLGVPFDGQLIARQVEKRPDHRGEDDKPECEPPVPFTAHLTLETDQRADAQTDQPPGQRDALTLAVENGRTGHAGPALSGILWHVISCHLGLAHDPLV